MYTRSRMTISGFVTNSNDAASAPKRGYCVKNHSRACAARCTLRALSALLSRNASPADEECRIASATASCSPITSASGCGFEPLDRQPYSTRARLSMTKSGALSPVSPNDGKRAAPEARSTSYISRSSPPGSRDKNGSMCAAKRAGGSPKPTAVRKRYTAISHDNVHA